MIINSGINNILNVPAFEVGNSYKQYDIVYYSGYTNPDVSPPTLHPCTQAESGHYYYSGLSPQTSTISNTPSAATDGGVALVDNPTNWTQTFFFESSYGSTVEYNTLYYSLEFGDGYYNWLNKSENSLKATFTTNLKKRTDAEAKAIIHLLEDSFNKGNKPSGGYTGINWTPFAPYNHSGEFFVQEFSHNIENPEVNTVNTQFYNDTVSATDWKQLYIPFGNTRGLYKNSIGSSAEQYYQHDAAFLQRPSPNAEHLLDTQSGWYYFTGEKHPHYTAETGIKGTEYNSPTGDFPLWTKNNFYFDISDNITINQSPKFVSQDLQNGYTERFDAGLNKKLLSFNLEFKNRTDKEAQAIIHFLEHHKGSQIFQFTPPAPYNFNDKVFLSPSWTHNLIYKDNNTVSVSFLEFPIDYLSLNPTFRTLITTVNRPAYNFQWDGTNGGSLGFGPLPGGAVEVKSRQENAEFVDNTGLAVFGMTGFALRTGFYLTNSGSDAILTKFSKNQLSGAQEAFEFPSGIVDPISIAPGSTKFVPFFFNPIAPNVYPLNNAGSAGDAGFPAKDGMYNSTITISTRRESDNTPDPSGNITLDISGIVTGWDNNPYKGNDGQNPMHPSKFLVQTGYYNASGLPLHILQWEHPVSGGWLTKYDLERSQAPSSAWTGIADFSSASSVDKPGDIRHTRVTTDDGSTVPIETLFYTGLYFPPFLTNQAFPEGGSSWSDTNTGIFQHPFYIANDINFSEDYYYRIRSEFSNVAGGCIGEVPASGSMYVYASGTNNFYGEVKNQVSTGLGVKSFASDGLITDAPDGGLSYTNNRDRIKIPVGPKPALKIYLDNESTNLNLSGLFIQSLVQRGCVNQSNNLDMVPPTTSWSEDQADAWLAVANTGAYADGFTGVQYILSPSFVVGSEDSTIPAIDTGNQLITGVFHPNASAGSSKKPVRETPTVLIMQNHSVIAGKGGDGGDGGCTLIDLEQVQDVATANSNNNNSSFSITSKVTTFKDSTAGQDGGDAIKISDPSICEFQIRRDYTAKILSGGGGGGGGDRYMSSAALALFNDITIKNPVWEGSGTGKSGTQYRVSDAPAGLSIHLDRHGYKQDVARWLHSGNWKKDAKIKLVDNKLVLEADYYTERMGYHNKIHHIGTYTQNLGVGGLTSVQYASPGGGGQGFKSSSGGRQLQPNSVENSLKITSMGGSFYSPGHGGDSSDDTNRSGGGRGGGFGENGQKGEDMSSITNEPFYDLNLSDEGVAFPGGNAGKAIRIISSSCYTSSNVFEKLLFVSPSRQGLNAVDGLIAEFDASQKVYSAYTNESTNTAATDGDSIIRWSSVNNPENVYLIQNDVPSAADPAIYRPKLKTTDLNTNIGNIKSSYFKKKPYVYFNPTYYGPYSGDTDREGAEFFRLKNATADADRFNDVKITGANGYAIGDYTSSGISVAALDSKLITGEKIIFTGGGVFELSADANASATTLYGTLTNQDVSVNEYGYVKLSGLSTGFDVFYVLYPDKWDAGGQFIGAPLPITSPPAKSYYFLTNGVVYSADEIDLNFPITSATPKFKAHISDSKSITEFPDGRIGFGSMDIYANTTSGSSTITIPNKTVTAAETVTVGDNKTLTISSALSIPELKPGDVIDFGSGVTFQIRANRAYGNKFRPTSGTTVLRGDVNGGSGQQITNGDNGTWTQNWLRVGQKVHGPDVPKNTTVTQITPSITLSNNVGATATNATLTFINASGIDQPYQTGWTRWSSLPSNDSGTIGFESEYYSRISAKVRDRMGVPQYTAGINQEIFEFNDEAINGNSDNWQVAPESAWIFNISSSRLNGKIYIVARINGNIVGEYSIRAKEYNFLAGNSEDVLIGCSSILGEFGANQQNGFKGAISHMAIYNRLLTAKENREVLGYLYNKYKTPNTRSAAEALSLDNQNTLAQQEGLAGEIFFE